MVVDNPLISSMSWKNLEIIDPPHFRHPAFAGNIFWTVAFHSSWSKTSWNLHVPTIELDMGTDCPSPDHLLMTQTAEICRSSWHSGRRVGLGLPAVEVMTFGVIYEWVVEDSNKYENIIYIYIIQYTHSSLSKSFGPSHFRIKRLLLHGWNPSF